MPQWTVIIPPAGVSPISSGAPVELIGPSKPPAILADDIDPETGDFRSLLSGVHPVDGMVVTAFRTRRGSGASVENVGHRFHEITHVNIDIDARIRYEYERTLSVLVKRGLVRIDAIHVDASGDSATSYCLYTNIRSMLQNRVDL